MYLGTLYIDLSLEVEISHFFLAVLVLVSENFRIIPSPTLFLENWYSSPDVKYSSK